MPKTKKTQICLALIVAAVAITVSVRLIFFESSGQIERSGMAPNSAEQCEQHQQTSKAREESASPPVTVESQDDHEFLAQRRREIGQMEEVEREAEREQRELDATLNRRPPSELLLRLEAMRAMREADDFHPPADSYTEKAKSLDQRIITANATLQEMKAEQLRLDADYEAKRQALEGMRDDNAIDSAKRMEAQKALADANRHKVQHAITLSRHRINVQNLVNERFRLNK
jgi:hypothetical protein